MIKILLVGLGGFVGAILRYVISGWIQKSSTSFPLGTLGVNVIGSFFLGFIMFSFENKGVFSDETRIFLTIGVLGSFTTMSTFSYETFQLWDDNIVYFFINILLNLFLCLFAIYLGRVLSYSIGG
ncbi:MAG: fluoride efflux transporter CrcB [Candidatus Heimdallarchaeota archaeon]|nr:fluoride efflux transporter CrcB [Candidatus Heimdallarchaeota archaeon]